MKYFWIFFSAYIWFLSVSPCCGGEMCGNDRKLTSSEASSPSLSAPHPEESHHDDICSPFCSCACCGSHALYVQPFHGIESVVAEQTAYKKPTYTFQFVSKFEPSIWQPPQLS